MSEAESLWDTPDSIPHLITLFSNLLVKCATLTQDTRSKNSSSKSQLRSSKKIQEAEKLLVKRFKIWKKAGKPLSKTDIIRSNYTAARSNLQTLRRYQDNLKSIKENNFLMQALPRNKNMIYKRMKRNRGESVRNLTSTLHSPAGTYCGDDILEGFAADAEYLGRASDHPSNYYNLCKQDNMYIFEFNSESEMKIPPMKLADLNHILYSKMKTGKSCDIYHLTVEHLRYCGDQAKMYLLALINRILNDIYYLTCPQIKLGLGTAVFKAKDKPITKSTSYRRITVTPILGAIIDYYIDPVAEQIFRPNQSKDQLGFTSGVSYLLGAIQRGECQRWALDKKLTCFGVSLDGEAAFPSVERDIQIRELYTNGERGDYLEYSRNTYKNTECQMKQSGRLSRRFAEYKGNRQGHVRASGHFKAYINPCLDTLNSSGLGFTIGPHCITTCCIADDAYVLTASASALQAALNIVSHYGHRYHLKFNASKTKIIIAGSKQDMTYYRDTKPWQLNGEKVSVVENNEHLGLIASGLDEEAKNIDKKITQCRNSLFALLGPAFSFKCLLSPLVQIHLWRVYNLPVILSGLCTLPIRPTHVKPLAIFHNKVLRGFLKVSSSSPVPALHFLFGELPLEAQLHIGTLTLFHNLWCNPHTTVHAIVRYVLRMCELSSLTWSNHIQLLCLKYNLPSPLGLLENSTPWSKDKWKCLVKTTITVYHERKLREMSSLNSKMKYLNVQLCGLSGCPHPALMNITTTQDVKKLRHHIKLLTGDLLTADRRAIDQPGLDPSCPLCSAPRETIEHVLVACKGTAEPRQRIYPELVNTVAQVQPTCEILHTHNDMILTQFILDCTSPNLPDHYRVPSHNPRVSEIFKISRDWSYAICIMRARLFNQKKAKTT